MKWLEVRERGFIPFSQIAILYEKSAEDDNIDIYINTIDGTEYIIGTLYFSLYEDNNKIIFKEMGYKEALGQVVLEKLLNCKNQIIDCNMIESILDEVLYECIGDHLHSILTYNYKDETIKKDLTNVLLRWVNHREKVREKIND